MRSEAFYRKQEVLGRRRRALDQGFRVLGMVLTLGTLGVLGILLLNLAVHGLSRIDWQFLTSFPSRRAGEAGILSAWVGTLLLMLVTAGVAVPLWVGRGDLS